MSNPPKAPDSHESLEAEREFLLRSLDDLDNELLAGNIEPDKYRVLHDDYTARASAVIQSIADGVARDAPGAPRVPRAMRAVTIGGIVAFAVLAAILLAHAVGARSPGGEITGDSQSKGTPTSVSEAAALAAAKAAATAQPTSYDAQISYARELMATGDLPTAIEEFVTSSQLDPTQAEPLAYAGWLTALVAQQVTVAATQKTLLDSAAKNLDQAIAADPTYPASYVFKGLLLSQIEKKPCAGAVALQEYLATAPANDSMRPEVLTALAKAVTAGKCPAAITSPTSPTTSKP
jgi:tetratricopeptide (TPR) repeat protein